VIYPAHRQGLDVILMGNCFNGEVRNFVTAREAEIEVRRPTAIEPPPKPTEAERKKIITFCESMLGEDLDPDLEPKLYLGPLTL
jgi:hypothetical protein